MVGDNVVVMSSNSFNSYVISNKEMVAKKPNNYNHKECATLPTIFNTSFYSLQHLAKLKKGYKGF